MLLLLLLDWDLPCDLPRDTRNETEQHHVGLASPVSCMFLMFVSMSMSMFVFMYVSTCMSMSMCLSLFIHGNIGTLHFTNLHVADCILHITYYVLNITNYV